MNYDIRYDGFVIDFFSLVDDFLHNVMGFASGMIELVTTPLLDLINEFISQIPTIFQIPFLVLEILLSLLPGDLGSVTIFSFVVSSAVFVYLGVVVVKFFIDLVN